MHLRVSRGHGTVRCMKFPRPLPPDSSDPRDRALRERMLTVSPSPVCEAVRHGTTRRPTAIARVRYTHLPVAAEQGDHEWWCCAGCLGAGRLEAYLLGIDNLWEVKFRNGDEK